MIERQILFEQSHAYFVEAQARPIRLTKIEVIDKTSAAQKTFFGIPGTLTVFVARKGSGAINDLRGALEKGGEDLVKLYRKMVEQVAPLERATLEEAVQQTVHEPVFADLRYGGATLAQGLSVPQEIDMTALFLPYNGGRLAQEGFILAEHFTEGSDTPLEALVVRIDPPLTKAERAALRLVPNDQAINNVGLNDWCDSTWIAVVIVAAAVVIPTAVTVTLAVTAADAATLVDVEPHIPEETLKQLGPAASARKLLETRRKILSDISQIK